MGIDVSVQRSTSPWFSDHESLRQLLVNLQSAIQLRQQLPSVVAEMVVETAERVLAHFWHEEGGGHLSQAVDAAPHLAQQAHALLDEHGELALQLRELMAWATVDVNLDPWWSRLDGLYAAFFSRFTAHEQAENRLLQLAFNEDLAAED